MTLLLMLCGLLTTVAWADVTMWVRATSAPTVFVFDYDNLDATCADYASWPGKQLEVSTATSDGQTWWLCHLPGTSNTSAIFDNGNSGNDNQTADITSLTSGTHYFYYNNAGFYLNLTAAKDAAAYAFLQPYGSVDWTAASATFAANGTTMTKCGGYNNGKDVYLWTSDTELTGNIEFERINPSDGSTWNSFTATYHKGGFYENNGWDSGYESNTQYQNIVFPGGVAHNSENFPDDNFRNWLSTNFPTETADGYWTQEELAQVTYIYCPYQNIASLEGIKYFTALIHLECDYNSITSLDLSNNTAVEIVLCKDNNLISLNVRGCSSLKQLVCDRSNISFGLTSLDVSDCVALTTLACGKNKSITSLDLSHNTALTGLSCNQCSLFSLDVSNNPLLNYLECSYNNIPSLDLSQNQNLNFLNCMGNRIYNLDVSQCPVLKTLLCQYNILTSLDVTNNTSLQSLDCRLNLLTSLDVTQNTALTSFYCNNNHLTSLELTGNTSITSYNINHQTVDIGRVNSAVKDGNTYYFVWLNDQYNGTDRVFVDIVHSLEGWTSPTFTPFDMSRVTWGEYCEKFTGTAQENNSNMAHPLALSDGLEASDIAGDILLLDDNTGYFIYYYDSDTNGRLGTMDVTVSWSGSSPTTAIDETMLNAQPVSVRYINPSGIGSDTPWPGMNIIVKTMDNGSHVITKEMR